MKHLPFLQKLEEVNFARLIKTAGFRVQMRALSAKSRLDECMGIIRTFEVAWSNIVGLHDRIEHGNLGDRPIFHQV